MEALGEYEEEENIEDSEQTSSTQKIQKVGDQEVHNQKEERATEVEDQGKITLVNPSPSYFQMPLATASTVDKKNPPAVSLEMSFSSSAGTNPFYMPMNTSLANYTTTPGYPSFGISNVSFL